MIAGNHLKYRNRLFSPLVTLWAFLSQVIDTDKTCHNAVRRLSVDEKGSDRQLFHLLTLGKPRYPTLNTGQIDGNRTGKVLSESLGEVLFGDEKGRFSRSQSQFQRSEFSSCDRQFELKEQRNSG